MIRMSALRNFPVVCDGERIGFMQDISMDLAQKKVEAFIISCGIRGKRIVLRKDVTAIADSFILVQSTRKYHHSFECVSVCFARDTTGLLSGRITDYAIGKDRMNVLAVEMQIGYGWSDRKRRIWVYDYERSVDCNYELTVPVSVGSELVNYEEGNRLCACQP